MPELWYTIGCGFLTPPSLRTQDFAKGCADIASRRGEHKTAPSVVRMTLSVASGRETDFVEGWVGGLAAPISGRVDLGGFHQHDRDIVLNGVYTAAFAAFQACAVRTQDHRLLANRADQHVKQILRNHRGYIVQRTKIGRAHV